MKENNRKVHFNDMHLVKKGQAAVEFALVMIILLGLLYGILEISRLLFIRAEIENAAREGAQYAALHPEVDDTLFNPCDPNGEQKTYAIGPKLTLIDKTDLALCVEKSFPTMLTPDGNKCGGVAPFCPVQVKVSYTWRSLVNFMPDMSTLSLKPLGPLEMEATSRRLIEGR